MLAKAVERLTTWINEMQADISTSHPTRTAPNLQRTVLIIPKQIQPRRKAGYTQLEHEVDEESNGDHNPELQTKGRRAYQNSESYKLKANLPNFNGIVDIE